MSDAPPADDALSALLAVTHEVIHGYGLAAALIASAGSAARPSALGAPALLARLRVHRQRRDDLTAVLLAAGAGAPAALASYALPFDVHDASTATRYALYLEDALVRRAHEAAGTTAGRDSRRLAAASLADCATTTVIYRRALGTAPAAAVRPFPGR